jgi:tetratricopeptide (TPR) repeat protein
MDREDKFYQACLELPLPEERDERDERSLPELAEVAQLRDDGRFQEAIDYGRALVKMFPDFDLIYYMIAHMYYEKERPAEAKQTAIEGIRECKRRYRLYAVAGMAEFDVGKLAEALVWWSRSIVAQCEVVEFQDHDPFLYLAHAAGIVGAKRSSETLFQMADVIEPSGYRLTADSLVKLNPLRKSWVAEPLRLVLKELESRLHARTA